MRLAGKRLQQAVSFPSCSTAYTGDEACLLGLPTYFKHHGVGPFESAWNTAAIALKEAERLVFVGYSFPTADAHLRYFLAAALNGNYALRRLTLLDPNADAIAASLRAPPWGEGWARRIRPLASRWEHGRFDLKADA
jgi:hypothetical protein